jgi:hypothetical protein
MISLLDTIFEVQLSGYKVSQFYKKYNPKKAKLMLKNYHSIETQKENLNKKKQAVEDIKQHVPNSWRPE